MSGWPSHDRSDERRLAEALAAGDADAAPHIFDGYAARLYDYCHALLRDADSAASAVTETFLAAAAHAGRLQDRDRFRGWLYALARNECLRRLHDPERPREPGLVRDPYNGMVRPRQEAPEVDDVYLDASERARRQEIRQLVHSALSGLSGRQREALDLLLRHALDVGEIAGVLGLAEPAAAELSAEARARLDDALAAAVIARTGRDECPSVAALVDSSEWPLTAAVCRKVIRHVETCPTCAARRSPAVSGARLLGALPVAQMPAALRGGVLTLLTEPLNAHTPPEIAEMRMAAAERAEPFDDYGWPVPVQGARAAARPSRGGSSVPRLWPALAVAAVVLMVLGGAFVILPRSSDSPEALASPSATAPADAAEESPTEPEEPTDTPEETPTDPPTTPTATPTVPTPEPSRTRRSPRPTRSAPPVENGTLQVSGCAIGPDADSCAITLTARGGRVRWSVISARGVSAGGGGTLEAGASASVTAGRPQCSQQDRGGQGQVYFSPTGVATVSWTCQDTPPPDESDPPGQG